ncbi:MAG: FAD-dependent monooxygenase, partial [Spirochaetia bacterium]|nr:FAD-dependent monooxygenase [Spirochaetia bacterium]
LILKELAKKNVSAGKKHIPVFVKKSIDARHGQLKYHLRYKVFIDEEPGEIKTSALPEWKSADGKKTVIIVGSGPAGLFGALKLLEKGIKPVIVERGERTSDRKKSIAKISTQDLVDSDSNYCFGEGGAGTFSDGKLYTRSNKRGDISKILQIFVRFGADEKILTDAHPHIGTDKLPAVINAMRNFIIEKGGEFYFNSKCTGFIGKNNCITGISMENTKSGEKLELKGDAVLLATGHSASDIYEMLAKISPHSLEAKTFAMGVRVEHPRTLIDSIQYHGKTEGMGAAEYRLVTQVEGRGVYSFCMCPGGFVVPSATGPDEIVVNGMSAAGRNSKWSNAAIVVETRPEDIPEEFVQRAKGAGCKALAGLYFRKYIEEETKKQGKGQAAPAQRMTDFLANRETKDFPPSSYTPGIVSSRIDIWMPEQIAGRLAQGFLDFGKNMKGFVNKDAVLIASETRTSTPVRILRDKESCESVAIKNMYPAGEGAGYAGGIVSSAMDGEKVCQAISEKI